MSQTDNQSSLQQHEITVDSTIEELNSRTVVESRLNEEMMRNDREVERDEIISAIKSLQKVQEINRRMYTEFQPQLNIQLENYQFCNENSEIHLTKSQFDFDQCTNNKEQSGLNEAVEMKSTIDEQQKLNDVNDQQVNQILFEGEANFNEAKQQLDDLKER